MRVFFGRLTRPVFEYLFVALLITSSFSGLISYLAVFLNNKIINLWKEITVIFLFSVSILLINKISERRFILFYFIFLSFVVFYSISFFYVKTILWAYQIKLDLVFFLTFWGWFFYFQSINSKRRIDIIKLVSAIVILGALLNAVFCIFEGVYPNSFLNALGVGDENWGADSGVKVISTMGRIRAPGLLSGFVQSGVFLFIGFIFIIESWAARSSRSKIIKALSIIVILLGMYYSTYKNAQVGLIVYLIWRAFILVSPSLRWFISWGITFALGIFFGFSTNGQSLYWLWQSFGKKLAYNSVYMRIEYHAEILAQCLKTLGSFVFGVGAGVNGVFGLDKSGLVKNAIPTDSTFIYVFSNYGALGVLCYLAFLCYGLNCSIRVDNRVSTFICIYFLSIDFFFNNMIVNFPSNLIFAVLLASAILEHLDLGRRIGFGNVRLTSA